MTTRSRARWGQLTLLAALLFGIVTMHTLGHPSGHGTGTGMSAAMRTGADTSADNGSDHSAYAMPAPSAMSAPSAPSAAPGPKMPPMSGMDPLSVCLAVLGGFTLVLLLAVAPGRPGADLLRPPARIRLPHALWPNAPPPRTLLARLSVLRI
ncbi:hypothetical protein O1M63_11670 [Streptomyces mirabilis]|uniref:hypothetical protein n=1 Tax=Streptomyces TaxID=1883 RepID=UPI001164E9D9|nr:MULTISPECIES: hypothetical protein [Streptomyces]MCX4608284.1 hypothetical protein [Streptomyces mirabilis]MCX5348749.1 hypothetical protein [Streptomyces mirabilis]MCZ0998662.1 hypothetical protein [Streptomyces mirabilis]QDN87315.1 hypothetical protein FNV61_18220 [Streptomyces sp. RLB3-6]QDO08129.1 hypothetical protein FNV68_19320 [Streptomyces sp. S1D4-23]